MANLKRIQAPDGTIYDVVDATALHSIPMASSSVLGGVKIPATGNITIDANGFIDDGIDFSGPNNVSFILDDNIGTGGISISKPNGESIDTCSWNYWMDDGTSSGYGNFTIQYGLDSNFSVYDPNSTAGLATTTSNGYMSAADKTKLDSIPSGIGTTTWYGTCSTTISTSAKVVTCTDFVLKTGAIIGIYFSTGNNAATPTLNINNTGAKSIYVGGSVPDSTTNVLKWSGGTVLYFMYDGSYYRYITAISAGSIAPPRGSNTWYGTTSISAATTAKTCTIDNFVLVKGAVVCITFTYTNTANALTLNINNTGAKAIYYNNAATSSSNKLTWDAGETLTFVYSGSYYYFVCKSKQSGGNGTVTSVRVQGTAPISSSVNTAQTGSLDTTISISDVTTTASGAMSAADKGKLDRITLTLNTDNTAWVMKDASANGIGLTVSSSGLQVVALRNNSRVNNFTLAPTNALTDTEIDNAVAAAVTVNNANTTSY